MIKCQTSGNSYSSANTIFIFETLYCFKYVRSKTTHYQFEEVIYK